jgi:hypothetical protein
MPHRLWGAVRVLLHAHGGKIYFTGTVEPSVGHAHQLRPPHAKFSSRLNLFADWKWLRKELNVGLKDLSFAGREKVG